MDLWFTTSTIHGMAKSDACIECRSEGISVSRGENEFASLGVSTVASRFKSKAGVYTELRGDKDCEPD